MNEYEKTLKEAKEEAKLAEWQERIRECENSGLGICKWCKKNGVSRKTYYRWHKKIMKGEYEETEIQFSEVPNIYLEPQKKEASVIVQKKGWGIEIQNNANPELVSIIIGTVARYV